MFLIHAKTGSMILLQRIIFQIHKNKEKTFRYIRQRPDVLDYYRTRFQIEFCFRNSKQFAGFTDCQSQDLNKLHFHFNASLTSVNIVKVKAFEEGIVLSMAFVKVLYLNLFLMQRFISVLGIKSDKEIDREVMARGS